MTDIFITLSKWHDVDGHKMTYAGNLKSNDEYAISLRVEGQVGGQVSICTQSWARYETV